MWWPSGPGYLFAVAKLNEQLYWVTGLVSPVHRSYQEDLFGLRAGNAVPLRGSADLGHRAAELVAGHPFTAEKCGAVIPHFFINFFLLIYRFRIPLL